MSAKVTEPNYHDVNTNDPKIRTAVANMAKRGYDAEQIQRIVGMPREVIDQHLRELKK